MSHCIVFIHVGPSIPQHTRDALAQARLFNSCPIYLLAEEAALAGFPLDSALGVTSVTCESLNLSDVHRRFRAGSKLDRSFRDGFWTFTTERFFYLETFIVQHGLSNIFHLENDNMVYVDLQTLLPIFEANYPNLAATFDNDQRCIAGFMYVHSAWSMRGLNDWIARALEQPESAGVNDMLLLGAYRGAGPAQIDHLPIMPRDYPRPLRSRAGHVAAQPQRYAHLIEQFRSLFDAAAIGQFVGGIDPVSTGGRQIANFVNESSVFDPSIYQYAWKTDEQNRRVPYLLSPTGAYRINNLHVHSKNLAAFRSRE